MTYEGIRQLRKETKQDALSYISKLSQVVQNLGGLVVIPVGGSERAGDAPFAVSESLHKFVVYSNENSKTVLTLDILDILTKMWDSEDGKSAKSKALLDMYLALLPDLLKSKEFPHIYISYFIESGNVEALKATAKELTTEVGYDNICGMIDFVRRTMYND